MKNPWIQDEQVGIGAMNGGYVEEEKWGLKP